MYSHNDCIAFGTLNPSVAPTKKVNPHEVFGGQRPGALGAPGRSQDVDRAKRILELNDQRVNGE